MAQFSCCDNLAPTDDRSALIEKFHGITFAEKWCIFRLGVELSASETNALRSYYAVHHSTSLR
jgi:hypothetical protein